QPAAHPVENNIERQEQVVPHVAQMREPPGVQDAGIELVAMRDQQLSPVGSHMNELVGQLHATEVLDEVAKELVVVPGRVEDSCAALHHVDDALEEERVSVGPVPALAQTPPVHEIPY